ncbi:hypothetical protein TCON_0994 [Astathelohania contejeani]|uniref:Derlin n=1 Tax=Astathelohania contejeani TaxID=164912 RepID=A0ABQ7I010_9MICR|nr:hypothetical protein TCON_0994 [Thelohania contejeani]
MRVFPPITKAVIILSLFIPLLSHLFPNLSQYFYFDKDLPIRTFPSRLITGIFFTPIDFRLFLNAVTRYKILYFIEIERTNLQHLPQIELFFFLSTLPISLYFSNCVSKLHTFNRCINLSLITYLSSFVKPFDIIKLFGWNVSPEMFPFCYAVYEMALADGNPTCVYGLIHGGVYIYLRRNILDIPKWFIWCYENTFGFLYKRKRKGRRYAPKIRYHNI